MIYFVNEFVGLLKWKNNIKRSFLNFNKILFKKIRDLKSRFKHLSFLFLGKYIGWLVKSSIFEGCFPTRILDLLYIVYFFSAWVKFLLCIHQNCSGSFYTSCFKNSFNTAVNFFENAWRVFYCEYLPCAKYSINVLLKNS